MVTIILVSWFNASRINILIGVLVCILLILFFIWKAKKTEEFYLRTISGLKAVDEALGRATEMGKPVLYTSGLGDMQRVATMASMNILNLVSQKVAEYGTTLLVPCYDPVVMATASETVQQGFSKVGRPDAFKPENVFFVTQSQFGYAAAVDGILEREKPATCFFLGTFEAEALILAETGNSIGAIQVAGTDSTIQLSFFIVACDYTLIGEELFAASGYLSQDKLILGSLKGQDILKILIIILLISGTILASLKIPALINFFTIK